ncbi:YbjQ family protein [Desulforudis sp. 1088]|uniref:YbjQ family protein n=1 Tax=unclassified Candidatus Desulforudis TaxID=2635950 RepID=UPI003479A596
MIVATSSTIAGKKVVKTLGVVTGSIIRSRHIGKDIVAGLRNVVGGEIKEYTELMADARQEAVKRMISQAEKLGANAVVDVRFATAQVMSMAAEILAYGTAVVVEQP